MRQAQWLVVSLAGLAALVAGCGGGGGHGGGFSGGTPAIQSINGSTAPSSPPGVAIEILGTNFGTNTGSVKFTQGSTVQTVTPATASGWSNTSILVVVPGGLAVPGSAAVTVVSAGGSTSAPVTLNLVNTSNFTPSNVTWSNTSALPSVRRGHAATAVQATAATAWVYVLGGNDGTNDVSTVFVGNVDATGSISTWTTTSALPATRAFLGAAEADPTNAPVALNAAYIYAVGGQTAATDAPGGNSSVFVGSVNIANGTVTWATTTALPQARVGCRAVVYNGFLHVTGGTDTAGVPIREVVSAPIQTNGTLGAFSTTGTANGAGLLTPVAYHEMFGFGGNLYVLGGDTGAAQTNPFSASSTNAIATVQKAAVRNGVVGTFASAGGALIKARSKFVVFQAFGQILLYEGVYGNTNFEGERSTILADGTVSSFNGQTGGTIPNLNLFNTAGVVSPILTASNNPRFLIIAGDQVVAPGSPVSTVARGGP